MTSSARPKRPFGLGTFVLMMVGIALQKGLLPVTLAAVEKAVALNGVEFADAVQLGRMPESEVGDRP